MSRSIGLSFIGIISGNHYTVACKWQHSALDKKDKKERVVNVGLHIIKGQSKQMHVIERKLSHLSDWKHTP